MRHVRVPLLCLLCLCLIALIAGCGSTVSGGGSTDSGTFTLGAEPALTIAQGQSLTLTVTPASTNQFKGSIQVSVSGLPAGVTVSPANATVADGVEHDIHADCGGGCGGGHDHGEGVRCVGNPEHEYFSRADGDGDDSTGSGDFTLAAVAGGADADAGRKRTGDAEQHGDAAASAGTIAIAVNNLPSGVTASPATISLSPNNPVVVTLTAASDAPATATPVQVSFVGTSGALSQRQRLR